MIWAILAALGVPLWIIALALLGIFLRNRKLRRRLGNIPVRIRRPGKARWKRGHAVWVSDVFAWRGSPASWSEDVVQVVGVCLYAPDEEQRKQLHRMGDDIVIGRLSLAGGSSIEVAALDEHLTKLPGPFGKVTAAV